MKKNKPISFLTIKINYANKGFTLVEVLVSLGIFSLVMIVVSQAFMSSLDAKKSLVARSQMINEMSFSLEHISRGIRMAKKSTDTINGGCLLAGEHINYELSSHTDCQGDTVQGIRFIAPNVTGPATTFDCVDFYKGCFNGQAALIESRRNLTTGEAFDLPLTSPLTTVIDFSVALDQYGWSQEDIIQPRVTLFIKVQDKEGGLMQAQTTVSQRNPDITR
jgi:prepilin-type N-terminal cleavage/methylation domain-containing protein